MKILWTILALVAGAMLPLQAGLNFRLGKAIESPLYSAAISFFVGTMAIVLYVLITRQNILVSGLKDVPVFAWTGGLFGAFYVTVVILAFPRIGPALTFGLVVSGQMIIAVLLDHFNVLVSQPHPITIWRLAGVVLLIVGVVLIRKF